mmetsp:Transcript_10316/g.24592  ORF Transcript_10316/g.24592 Transcript_10316/m.24592 type:complete len:293 (+) Transcript_10316:102-980(+)
MFQSARVLVRVDRHRHSLVNLGESNQGVLFAVAAYGTFVIAQCVLVDTPAVIQSRLQVPLQRFDFLRVVVVLAVVCQKHGYPKSQHGAHQDGHKKGKSGQGFPLPESGLTHGRPAGNVVVVGMVLVSVVAVVVLELVVRQLGLAAPIPQDRGQGVAVQSDVVHHKQANSVKGIIVDPVDDSGVHVRLGVVVDDRRETAHTQSGRDPVYLPDCLDLAQGIVIARSRRAQLVAVVCRLVVRALLGVVLQLTVQDRLSIRAWKDAVFARIAGHERIFHPVLLRTRSGVNVMSIHG